MGMFFGEILQYGYNIYLQMKQLHLYTVNVDIFALLNFRASSPRCHLRAD